MMKNLRCLPACLVLVLLTGCLALFGQGTWEKRLLPTHQTLRNVVFTDSLTGWLAGDSGVILHTADGGHTWQFQESHTTNEITSVFFIDANRGWASAFNFTQPPYGTELLKTSNGGQTWTKYTYPQEDIFITSIFYHDSLNGWMGGKPHAIVKTADGGQTWSQASVDTSILAFFPVLTIRFYDRKYGYASGGIFDIAGVIWRTWNGGEKWYAMDPSDAPADEVHALHFFDSLRVMGAGGDPDFGYGVGMIRTFNGGVNWQYDELDVQGYATDLDFRTKKDAWAPLGPQRKMLFSADTGQTWTVFIPPDTAEIFKICFPDSLHGYAVGKDGAFLVYHPPVIPSAEPEPESSSGIRLMISPNPVEGVATFRVQIAPDQSFRSPAHRNGQFRIAITDLFGRIREFTEAFPAAPGEYELSHDLGGVAGGVYFCRFYLGHQPVPNSGRMILLKR